MNHSLGKRIVTYIDIRSCNVSMERSRECIRDTTSCPCQVTVEFWNKHPLYTCTLRPPLVLCCRSGFDVLKCYIYRPSSVSSVMARILQRRVSTRKHHDTAQTELRRNHVLSTGRNQLARDRNQTLQSATRRTFVMAPTPRLSDLKEHMVAFSRLRTRVSHMSSPRTV